MWSEVTVGASFDLLTQLPGLNFFHFYRVQGAGGKSRNTFKHNNWLFLCENSGLSRILNVAE